MKRPANKSDARETTLARQRALIRALIEEFEETERCAGTGESETVVYLRPRATARDPFAERRIASGPADIIPFPRGGVV